MAKKWSQKTEKARLAAEDEFLIIDSEDATPATKNKRVKVKNATPYKKYVALLTQTATNAPAAIVLENTLGGTIIWTRTSQGNYAGTLAGAFPDDKTVVITGTPNLAAYTILGYKNAFDPDNIYVNTRNSATPFATVDGALTITAIEIRVYTIAIP